MPSRRSSDKKFLELSQEIDIDKFRKSIQDHFGDFPDPRRQGSTLYPAWYLLLIMLSGYLAGANTILDIAHFAELRSEWLAGLLGKEIRPPSYDTLWWFVVRVEPRAFPYWQSRYACLHRCGGTRRIYFPFGGYVHALALVWRHGPSQR